MDYHDEVAQLEPDVFGLLKKLHDGTSYSGIQTASVVSIAISLKRIADALTYQESAPENLFDHIRAARYATEGMENRRG